MDPIFSSLTPAIAFLDIGGGEFIFIVLVALVLFGGKLPDVARNVGRTVGSLKRQADDLTREFRDEFNDASRPHQPPRRYDPPSRSVPTKDDRSLSADASSGDDSPADDHLDHHVSDDFHEGDGLDDDAIDDEATDDGMIHAPEEEMKRADDAAFHRPMYDGEHPNQDGVDNIHGDETVEPSSDTNEPKNDDAATGGDSSQSS